MSTAGQHTTTDTFTAEPLPPRTDCPNCTELRRLLAAMRHRVDEVEAAYAALKHANTPSDGSEIISDLPPSSNGQ